MLSLHNEAAVSLCDSMMWGERGRGSDTQSMMRDLLSTQGDAWHLVTENIFPCVTGIRAHKAKVVMNLRKGAWPELGCPSPGMGWGNTSSPCQCALIIYLFIYGHTCLCWYSRNDFSWSIHSVAGFGINTERQRRQHSLCTPISFGIFPPPQMAFPFSFEQAAYLDSEAFHN